MVIYIVDITACVPKTQTQISTLNKGLKSFCGPWCSGQFDNLHACVTNLAFLVIVFSNFFNLNPPTYSVKLLLEITGPKTMFKLRKLMGIRRNFGTWWPKKSNWKKLDQNTETENEFNPWAKPPKKKHIFHLMPKNEHKNCVKITDLAQPISWMTDPQRRKVQLKANPTAFQYGPNKPSSTSNHCTQFSKKKIGFRP